MTNQIAVTVALNKGGTGKTTTVQALMAGLVSKGYKVLAIDLDGQGNLSVAVGASRTKGTIYDVLVNGVDINKTVQKTEYGDIIASSPNLANLDIIMSRTIGKEFRLRDEMANLKQRYDFVLIDTPPSLGVELYNALTYSNYVLFAVQPDSFSINGMDMVGKTVISQIRRNMNPNLRILGILLTRCKKRTDLYKQSRELFSQIAKEMDTRLFESAISDSVHIQEIQSYSVEFYSNSRNTAIKDYRAFVEEFLQEVAQ